MKLSKGFTLIELIVVITIVGILAVVLIVALNPAMQIKKAKDSTRKTDLKNIQNSLEQYYNDNGVYPIYSSGCLSGQACWTLGAGSFLGTNASNYIKFLPSDPSQSGTDCTSANSKVYAYYSNATGTTYTLSTRLENTTDPSIATGSVNKYTSPADGPCTIHNYKQVSQQQ